MSYDQRTRGASGTKRAGGSSHSDGSVDEGRARLVRTLTAVVGATFLLVGILGFVPGVTTNVGDMHFAGHESPSQLFDIFWVSVLHNSVHVLYGIVGLVAARTLRASRLYLLIGGATYLLLFLYGLVIDLNESANFLPLNDADNWLHFGLGLGMIALGLIPTSRHVDRRERTSAR